MIVNDKKDAVTLSVFGVALLRECQKRNMNTPPKYRWIKSAEPTSPYQYVYNSDPAVYTVVGSCDFNYSGTAFGDSWWECLGAKGRTRSIQASKSLIEDIIAAQDKEAGSQDLVFRLEHIAAPRVGLGLFDHEIRTLRAAAEFIRQTTATKTAEVVK